MFKRKFLLLLAVLVIVFSLAACAQEAGSLKGAEASKEITLCESWAFESGFSVVITPDNASNYGANYYSANFYETLVNYENGDIVPGLAENWNISNDGLAYTFYLKQGVKFSDGADLNAEAVKKSLEMAPVLLGDYNGSYGLTTTLFDKIIAVDDYTVEIRLTAPYYGALQDMSILNPMGIMSPNAYNDDGTLSEVLKTSTLGTGPYMYAGETEGSTYTFVKNPHYWGEEPEVDVFHIKVIADNASKALALRSGEIDMIFGSDKLSYDGFNDFAKDGNYGVKISEADSLTRFLGFNVAKAPFDDFSVRKAVSLAIDKQSISDNLFYGIEAKADKLFSPSLPYCNIDIEPYEYDIEAAKAILEQAGWVDTDGDGIREKDGVKLEGEILYSSGSAVLDDLCLALEAYMEQIGMDVTVTAMDMMAWYAETLQGNFTMNMNFTYGVPYDPYAMINNMNTQIMADNVAAMALAHLENGDEIITGLSTMVDTEQIRHTIEFILTEIHENAVYVPISYTKELAVYNLELIADYSFYGQPAMTNIAGIKLK